jgi:hypothetical protein
MENILTLPGRISSIMSVPFGRAAPTCESELKGVA